jgi:ankyrin repeat protein
LNRESWSGLEKRERTKATSRGFFVSRGRAPRSRLADRAFADVKKDLARAARLALLVLLASQASAIAQTKPDIDLIDAAKLGELARTKELLSRGAGLNAMDARGYTPLMWASAGGHTELVRHLLESGAAPDRRAADGTTALMLAAANGSTEVVRVLLSRGVNVAALKGGVSAHQLAIARGHSAAAALLAQADGLGARLIQAAIDGHDALVRQLLVLGAPVNVTDKHGATALMIAARNGDLGVLQLLLSKGGDGSARDAEGQTVFDWAERAPETGKHVVLFLFDRGVSRDALRPPARSQAPAVTVSLRALESVLARMPAGSGQLRQDLHRASSALSQLQALSASWPAESPENYRLNLATEVRSLEAALHQGDIVKLAATVQSAAEDLEVKLEHCTRSGGKLGGAVAVRVRTLLGSAEIKSWQVFYMPKVLEAAENESPDAFPQLSSPTEEALVPGRYVMWLRDPTTAKLGERTVVKVGEGRKELLLELPVPTDTPQ